MVAFTGPAVAQGGINFTFEHQDPAEDVLKYNMTLNGTPSDDFEGLDLKWLNSEKVGDDLVIELDLKAKEKFRIENGTKYVLRILTSPDNSTGYNITYRNGTTIMNSFAQGANGTSEDISSNVSFVREKGDEAMEITVSITDHLVNITHYGLDAYSMKVTHNATYLDYISELPGHPEYVNPDVADEEDLPTNGGGDDDDDDDEGSNVFLICSIIGVIVFIIAAIVVIIVVVILLMKKKAKEPEAQKKSGRKPRPPPPPPDD
jgi:hypothetical protein